MLNAYSDSLLHGWPARFLKRLTWLADHEALHRLFCERDCESVRDEDDCWVDAA